MAKLPELHARIAEIRKANGYLPADRLKFDTNARPKHVSVEAATAAKRDVVSACIACDCKFIAYVILHSIARNTTLLASSISSCSAKTHTALSLWTDFLMASNSITYLTSSLVASNFKKVNLLSLTALHSFHLLASTLLT
jgi:hypothetical protein